MRAGYTHVKQTTTDSLPREVALEFLTNPKAKLSNTFRKTCRAALDAVFVPVPPPASEKPEVRFGRKLKSKTMLQLVTLRRRTAQRQARVMRVYSDLQALIFAQRGGEPTPQEKAYLRALDQQGIALDFVREAIEVELRARKSSL